MSAKRDAYYANPPHPGMIKVYGTDGSWGWMPREIGRRTMWVIAVFAMLGKWFHVTETYRPVGQEDPDRRVRREEDTALGVSTQWFQKGREDRKETPSAAWPGSSPHGEYIDPRGAIDCSVQDLALRTSLFARVGMFARIHAEPWHFQIYSPINSDIVLPNPESEGFLMSLSSSQQKSIHDTTVSIPGLLKSMETRIMARFDIIERRIADSAPVRAFNIGTGIELVSTITGRMFPISNTTYYRLYEGYGLFSGRATDIPEYLLAHYRDVYSKLDNPEATAEEIAEAIARLDESAKAAPQARFEVLGVSPVEVYGDAAEVDFTTPAPTDAPQQTEG